MDYSVTFARHFSRLIWLLVHEKDNVDEQKAALRALVTVSKDGTVVMLIQEYRLHVNGVPFPEVMTGAQNLTERMIGHGVRKLVADQGVAPADLLGVARLLAVEPAGEDGGAAIERAVLALDAHTVRVTVEKPTGVSAPSVELPAVTRVPTPAGGGLLITRDLVSDEPAEPYLAFAAVQGTGSSGDLVKQLDGTRSVNIVTRILDELVTVAENAARDGKPDLAAQVCAEIVQREAASVDDDMRRAYGMAIRRVCKPTVLRTVAALVPRRVEREQEYFAILSRAGEDGADALIEQLTTAQSLNDRRLYFEMLVKLNAGIPALVHMLGDARWHVARNAADLLGEMQAAEADAPLAELLRHNDERVRRAAVAALGKLDTPKSTEGLGEALSDASPQVRIQAAMGLALRKGAKAATVLGRAFDEEADPDVQLALLSALGKVGTPEAVQRLIKAAEPDGRLFKKKPVAFRVTAVQALAEAKTAAAVTALQELLNDKDKEVREAVVRVVMQANKASEAS